jgi:hypothetical protein
VDELLEILEPLGRERVRSGLASMHCHPQSADEQDGDDRGEDNGGDGDCVGRHWLAAEAGRRLLRAAERYGAIHGSCAADRIRGDKHDL